MNHVLKQNVEWKAKSLPEFISIVEQYVTGQFKGLRSALVCVGEFRLAKTHAAFQKSKTEWTEMSDKQRLNHYSKFRRYVYSTDRLVTSTDGKTAVLAPRTDGKKPGQRKRKINAKTLSLKHKRQKNDVCTE